MKTILMEQLEKSIEIWKELNELTIGSKIKVINGNETFFLKLKRKNLERNIDGKCYQIPLLVFDKIFENKEHNKNLIEFYLGIHPVTGQPIILDK